MDILVESLLFCLLSFTIRKVELCVKVCVCRFVNTRNINRESLFYLHLSSSIDAAHITCLHAAAAAVFSARLLVVLLMRSEISEPPPGCLFLLEAIVGALVAGQLGFPSAGLIPYH